MSTKPQMNSTGSIRRQAFRAALLIDHLTMGEWCDAHGVSRSHLLQVLGNRRPSHRLTRSLDSYIAATLVPFCQTVLAVIQERPNASAA